MLQLNYYERRVFHMLKRVPANSAFGGYLQEELRNPTTQKIRAIIQQAQTDWNDSPQVARAVLGFDLPKYLNMKKYTTEELNQQFTQMGFVYRAIMPAVSIGGESAWIARAGHFTLLDITGTTYICSRLNRYVRLSNGQMFVCSDGDLQGMSEDHKQETLFYLESLTI